jgi:signal transduction histidine kinase
VYYNQRKWKFFLILFALLIGLSSIIYTSKLVNKLSNEERKKVELWAEGMKQLNSNIDPNQDISFIFKVIENNETVPVIVTDSLQNILFFRNLDSTKVADSLFLKQKLKAMAKTNTPIKINITDDITQYVYYENSILLQQLYYYPYIQITIIILFVFIAYLAFSSSRKAEQNQVWVGMSKETAHQLGTPTSSLLAWIELLKNDTKTNTIATEIEKDVKRLELITERFSKIGSKPVINTCNIINTVNRALDYMEKRISNKFTIQKQYSHTNIEAPINPALFEWVIENICKNAVDAMGTEGELKVEINSQPQLVYIDISDTGKGIPKTKHKSVFKPGYTTKKRGWGLGL